MSHIRTFPITIELTLVDLSSSLRKDNDGHIVEELAERVLSCCISPPSSAQDTRDDTKPLDSSRRRRSETVTVNDDDDQENDGDDELRRQRVLTSVIRFLRTNDKYLALTSTLLKSRAYHLVASMHTLPPLPVAELPRTRLGKPFIPTALQKDNNKGHDRRRRRMCPSVGISVSHQSPFAGIAAYTAHTITNNSDDDDDDDDDDIPPENHRPLGLDIVVFEDINTRLYNSVDEFIAMFRDSFTTWEWKRIHCNQINDDKALLLQEFYLRWATKEAYTKALGVGMEAPFSSFKIHLGSLEDPPGGLATKVLREGSTLRSRASVIHYDNEGIEEYVEKRRETGCDFFFVPLASGDDDHDDNNRSFVGCACVCVTGAEEESDVNVQWMEFDRLVQWHRNPLL